MDEYELQCIPVSEYVSEIVKVVKELGASREIFYSSFHPDACIELSIQQVILSLPYFIEPHVFLNHL